MLGSLIGAEIVSLYEFLRFNIFLILLPGSGSTVQNVILQCQPEVVYINQLLEVTTDRRSYTMKFRDFII